MTEFTELLGLIDDIEDHLSNIERKLDEVDGAPFGTVPRILDDAARSRNRACDKLYLLKKAIEAAEQDALSAEAATPRVFLARSATLSDQPLVREGM